MLLVRNQVGSVQSYAMVVSLVAMGGVASLSKVGGSLEQTITGAASSDAWIEAEHPMLPAVTSASQAGSFGKAVKLARQAMRNAGVTAEKIEKAFNVADEVLARPRTHIHAEAALLDTGDTIFVPTSSRRVATASHALDFGDDVRARVVDAVSSQNFTGAVGSHLEVDGAGTGFKKIVLVGLGDSQKTADLRDIGHQIGKLARGGDSNGTTSQILLRSADSAAYQQLTEGLLLADYSFDWFKSSAKDRKALRVAVAGDGAGWNASASEGIARGNEVADSVALARDLTELPPNVLNTNELVALSARIADRRGLDFEVLSKPDLLKQNMNLLHGVGMASESPPYLVRLRHQGAGSRHVAAVGKGITYDSGGLSIKSNPSGMKGDMTGAGVVLAAIDGAAARGVDTTVDVYLPLAENVIASNAQRVDDVVRGRSGLSVEIGNTDAEGRLVMADALAYATEDGPRKPDSIMTVSTLTGANASTFGGEYAGLFTRYDALGEQLLRAADAAGENVWRMPMDEFYDARLGSRIADIGNIGSGGAGAITAAIFLSKHVGGDVPFAQLDIAGTALRSSSRGRIPAGATGSATATLIDWFTNP